MKSPCHQHLAVGQQRRRVFTACGVEAARVGPGPSVRVVKLRAAKFGAAIISPYHQHLAVGQQRRRVISARGVEAARGRPAPGRGVVKFRAAKKVAAEGPLSPCHQYLAVGQQRRRVNCARGVEATRVAKCKRIDGREDRSRHRTGTRQILIAFQGRRVGRAQITRCRSGLETGGQQDRRDHDQSGREGDLKRRCAGRVISSVFHICFWVVVAFLKSFLAVHRNSRCLFVTGKTTRDALDFARRLRQRGA